MDTSYVMGDDPERMDAGAVIVAKPVRRAIAQTGAPNAGYLYLVLHTQQLPADRLDVLRSSFARPAMVLVVAVVAFTTLLALLIISAVTKPLRTLTQAVATLSQRGLAEGLTVAPTSPLPTPTRDEFGQLTGAFEMLLDVCRRQWNALRRTDHFRREGVSNLSHDLRSPLTATVACLETLDSRWIDAGERDDDRRLVEIALRNTRNAAAMVRSLGDLAKLDEPEYSLRPRGGRRQRAARRHRPALRRARGAAGRRPAGAAGRARAPARRRRTRGSTSSCSSGRSPTWSTTRSSSARAAAPSRSRRGDATRRSRSASPTTGRASPRPTCRISSTASTRAGPSVAPATADGGRGLGLAIVKRIVELHDGRGRGREPPRRRHAGDDPLARGDLTPRSHREKPSCLASGRALQWPDSRRHLLGAVAREVSEETAAANRAGARSGLKSRPSGRRRNRSGAPGDRCPFVLRRSARRLRRGATTRRKPGIVPRADRGDRAPAPALSYHAGRLRFAPPVHDPIHPSPARRRHPRPAGRARPAVAAARRGRGRLQRREPPDQLRHGARRGRAEGGELGACTACAAGCRACSRPSPTSAPARSRR